MPWTVAYDPDFDFVITVYEGRLTGEDLRAEEDQSLALAIEKGTSRFLVDLANYEGSVSVVDIFDCPSRYEDELTRPIYIAVVKPLSQEAQKDADFYETVCLNRGWTVNTFTTKKDALAWLTESKLD